MQEALSNQDESNSLKLQQDKSESPSQKSQQNQSRKRVHRKQEISNFIMKTYKILEDKKNSHIIEWTDNGSCFIVKNKDLFQNQILPKYFKHKKFSSFVRQLNMYDFHKIRKEKQIPIFKHKFFRMGSFQLLHKIKRKSGEDGKQEDPSKILISQGDLSMKNEELPMKSALSIRSKGTFNAGEDIQQLIRENNELKNIIGQLNKEINAFQLTKSKKQEKLIKLLSALIYFDMRQPIDGNEEKFTLRELQNHFANEEDPLSFLDYAKKLGYIYRDIYSQVTSL